MQYIIQNRSTVLIAALFSIIFLTVVLHDRIKPIILRHDKVKIESATDSYVNVNHYKKDGPIVLFGLNMTTFKNVVKGDPSTALSEGRIPEYFKLVEFTFDDKVAYENAHYVSKIDRSLFHPKDRFKNSVIDDGIVFIYQLNKNEINGIEPSNPYITKKYDKFFGLKYIFVPKNMTLYQFKSELRKYLSK